MWQLLVAAAVAGSGLIAKNLFNPIADYTTNPPQESATKNNDQTKNEIQQESEPFQVDSLLNTHLEKDGIFRFSSTNSLGNGSGSRGNVLKKVKKKKMGKIKHARGVEVQKLERRFSACLKKRRTGKKCSVKCGSCSSKGDSLFGWGLGVGIMYMMSAGKAEISKLNTAMDETAKVVHDLKNELYKRKEHPKSPSQHIIDAKRSRGEHALAAVTKRSPQNKNPKDANVLCLRGPEDGDYSSSVLTEESEAPGPDVVQMNHLEAELESELQKLSCCTTETSFHEEIGSELETEDFSKELRKQCSSSYQFGGVVPSELDKKLSKLLIKQQESQIHELESELHLANSKLHEREAELQALKDCVRRLSQVSLSNISDDENELHVEHKRISNVEQERISNCNLMNKMEHELVKPVVGMKRSIDSEPGDYNFQ